MITVGKVWQAQCEACSRTIESRVSHVDVMALGVLRGWAFQYEECSGVPRYQWAAYCHEHSGQMVDRLIPDDLRCGVSRMRHAVRNRLQGGDETFVAERIR